MVHIAGMAKDIIGKGNNGRLLGPSWRTCDRKEAGDCGANLIETGSIRPRSLLTVHSDDCMNQSGLLRAKRFGIEAVLLQKSGTFIGKEYISIFKQLIEFFSIFLRIIEDR